MSEPLSKRRTVVRRIKTPQTSFFRGVLLMDLADDIDETDAERIRFLLKSHIKKKILNTKQSMLQLFVHMEQEGLLSPTNVKLLESLMESIRRPELVDRIRQFAVPLIERSSPVGANPDTLGNRTPSAGTVILSSSEGENNTNADETAGVIPGSLLQKIVNDVKGNVEDLGMELGFPAQRMDQLRQMYPDDFERTLVILTEWQNSRTDKGQIGSTLFFILNKLDYKTTAEVLKQWVESSIEGMARTQGQTENNYASVREAKPLVLNTRTDETGREHVQQQLQQLFVSQRLDPQPMPQIGAVAPGLQGQCQTIVVPMNQGQNEVIFGNPDSLLVVPGNQGQNVVIPGNQSQMLRAPGNQGQNVVIPGNQSQMLGAPGNQGQNVVIPGNQSQMLQAPGNQGQNVVSPGNQSQILGAPGNQGQNHDTQPTDVPQVPKAQVRRVTDTLETMATYSMNNNPRGWCVIINNVDFFVDGDTAQQMPKRMGSDKDAESLQHVFTKLGFIVRRYDNLSDTQMMSRLIDFAHNIDHSKFDCFVCCILTHGVLNHLYGANGMLVSVKDLTATYQANRCPTLAGKPKLFFLQACQGRDKMKGQEIERDAGGDIAIDNDVKEMIPNEADFLLGYATVPGYVSFRSRNHGSWYIRKLCELLDKLSNRHDILSILTEVNNQVSSANANMDGGSYKQVPAPLFTLRKRLYLNPVN